MSNEKWNFHYEENENENEIEIDTFYIENDSTKKVLEAVVEAVPGEVVLEDLVKGYAKQLWYKDKSYDPDAEGYFMLKNLENYNDYGDDNDIVLTAQISTEIRLEMQGNISLSWIVN